MKRLDKNLFYNYGPVRSRNGVFNFIVGGRGIGKTYGAKKAAIDAFITKGHMFIYLRRYRDELSAARKTFFADVSREFPDYIFRDAEGKAQICRNPEAEKGDRVWEDMGYFVNLSTAQQFKSVSYERVRTIIFDEFIIEKGAVQYLTNEARVMMDFYQTVDRWMDKTTVFFLANSVSIINPYFMEWNIQPTREWVTRNKGFIICHFPADGEFGEAVRKTRFGQFIAGTEYEAYSIGNQFRDNHESMLGDKTADHKYMFTLETETGIFSCWSHWTMETSTTWHVQAKRPGDEVVLTMVAASMDETKRLVAFNSPILGSLRTAFRHGAVTFDSPTTRNQFIHIFNRKA